ncbi:unnamed protein product [Amoebophrya sp. A120]|nr:unnamed protein product [Amoebophrya sp. A120]|eukprot:GSA120T00012449001.1
MANPFEDEEDLISRDAGERGGSNSFFQRSAKKKKNYSTPPQNYSSGPGSSSRQQLFSPGLLGIDCTEDEDRGNTNNSTAARRSLQSGGTVRSARRRLLDNWQVTNGHPWQGQNGYAYVGDRPPQRRANGDEVNHGQNGPGEQTGLLAGQDRFSGAYEAYQEPELFELKKCFGCIAPCVVHSVLLVLFWSAYILLCLIHCFPALPFGEAAAAPENDQAPYRRSVDPATRTMLQRATWWMQFGHEMQFALGCYLCGVMSMVEVKIYHSKSHLWWRLAISPFYLLLPFHHADEWRFLNPTPPQQPEEYRTTPLWIQELFRPKAGRQGSAWILLLLFIGSWLVVVSQLFQASVTEWMTKSQYDRWLKAEEAKKTEKKLLKEAKDKLKEIKKEVRNKDSNNSSSGEQQDDHGDQENLSGENIGSPVSHRSEATYDRGCTGGFGTSSGSSGKNKKHKMKRGSGAANNV